MKKVRNLFVMVCFCCAATSFIMAQNDITKSDVMHANRKIYELVNRYADFSDFTNEYQKHFTYFDYLFDKKDLIDLPKDLLPWYTYSTDNSDKVIFKDYKDFVAVHHNELSYYEVKDAYISNIEIKRGQINYQVRVTKVETMKESKVTDSCKILLHITYDMNTRDAKITNITWEQKGLHFQPYVTAKYVVTDMNNKQIPKTIKTINGVTLGSEPIAINEKDYAVNPSFETMLLSLDSIFNGRERTYFVNSRKNSLGVSAEFMAGFVNAKRDVLANGNAEFDNVKASVFNWSLGVDYYRQLFLNGKHRLGLDVGLLFGKYHMRFLCDYNDNYMATDEDGDMYNRYISIRNYQEKTGNFSITLPVAVRYDWFFKRNVSLAASIGARGKLLLPQKTKATFDGEYAGYYSDLFGIYMDQNGYYDYGRFDGRDLSTKGNAGKMVAASLFGTVGIQYFITDFWSLDANIIYDYQLTKSIKQVDNCHLSSDYNNFQSFTYFLKSFPKHYLGVNVRLKYNF